MEVYGYKPQRCNCGKEFYLQTAFPFPIFRLNCSKCTRGTEDRILRAGLVEEQLRTLLAQRINKEVKGKTMLALGALLLEYYTESVMNRKRLMKTEEADRLLRQAAAMGVLSEEEQTWVFDELNQKGRTYED